MVFKFPKSIFSPVKFIQRDLEIKVKPSKNPKHLDETLFWKIIAALDWSNIGNNNAILARAIQLLAKQPTHFIYQFQDFLSEKLYRLDAKKYALHIGQDALQVGKYFSTDQFLYARCCVIANGQEAFNTVLRNPEMMPKDLTFEPLLSLAAKAFELKTSQPFHYFPTYNYETYSNEASWQA